MALSIIVANYNHGPLIARSLGALTAQMPAGSEIVLVDDGSTDDSIAVIERLQVRCPSIRLIRHDVNRGVSAAVQTALDAATGDYLFFSAADDWILPNLLPRALSALSANPEAAFFCSSVAVFNDQDKVVGFRPAMVPRTTAGYVSPGEARRLFAGADNFVIGTSVVHRRKCLAEVGYFDNSLGSLCDGMAYRLMALRYGFFFDPDVLASFGISPESYSARSALSVPDSMRMVDTATRWIRRQFPEDVRDRYAGLFARRLRFSIGRHWTVWRKNSLDVDAMTKIMDLTTFDGTVMKILSAIPQISSKLILAWISLRMWPYSPWALLKGYGFNRRYRLQQRAYIEQSLAAARPPRA